jgi:hypothetical protein
LEFTSLQIIEYEMLLRRTLTLVRRLGLPEDAQQAVLTIQRLISIAIQLERAYRLLETAMEIGLGPVGWVSMALRVSSSIATMSQLC